VRQMHMYVWSHFADYIAVVQASSVEEARALLLEEIGGGDSSCPEREKAAKYVQENTPAIWYGPNAAFALTDSAEQREQIDYYEKKLVAARADALEYAAQIADAHWPESGHVHQDGAVSCQMTVSVDIRRAKGVGYEKWQPTEREKNIWRKFRMAIARCAQERGRENVCDFIDEYLNDGGREAKHGDSER
jgi:hypothetical protein